MSAHDSNVDYWTDPKDYGLPYVKITPIRRRTEPQIRDLDQNTSASIARADHSQGGQGAGDSSRVEPVAKSTEAIRNADSSTRTPVSLSNGEIEGKQSSRWLWAVALIGLGIIAVIVWQIQANKNAPDTESTFEIVDGPAEASTSVTTADSPSTDQNQNSVNQDTISLSGISNPNISKPAETGTTIANTAVGNLIRVESKADRAQYFIIVGSLPNEKMALAEANQYLGRSAELYLITPVDGSKNYRLALSKFDSFRMAAAKREEIKSQYTEELWILKY